MIHNKESVVLNILSIYYNEQWRKTTIYTQRFARLRILTLKFTIADDDDTSQIDNESMNFEINCNDEASNCTMTSRLMSVRQKFDDMNFHIENSLTAIDVYNAFQTIQFHF